MLAFAGALAAVARNHDSHRRKEASSFVVSLDGPRRPGSPIVLVAAPVAGSQLLSAPASIDSAIAYVRS
jgi:hypothetical protein